MKLKTLMLCLFGAGRRGAAPEMADSMTLVSWGGAYQASQVNAYAEPYRR
jgi:putative spermidine/putrescine transport system substrate-binding protein